MPQTLQTTLDFLRELDENNNKPWFDAHRERYHAARAQFEGLVEDLIVQFAEVDDLGGVTAKECIFRINRDIRFSPDKTPYNAHMSAVLARGGRKGAGRSYYLHIKPGGESFLGAGLYAPATAQLDAMRRAIAEDASKLKAVTSGSDFVRYFGALQGQALKTAPQGYPKDHPEIELLRLKQYMAVHPFRDADVLSEEFVPQALAACAAVKPYLVYLHSVVDGVR